MIRTLWFLLRLAVFVALAVWLAERPGRVSISWQGWQIDTSVGVLLTIVLVVIVLAAWLYSGWRMLRRAPGEMRRARRIQRVERGYDAISKGLVALAAGDFSRARAQARKANGLAPESPLALLLGAQVAQAEGDKVSAQRFYTAMLERDDTTFLALRGLAADAVRNGDADRALDLLAQARIAQPKAVWIPAARFEVLTRAGRWEEASRALVDAVKLKAIDAATGKRYEAAILLERARVAEVKGETETAAELALRAQKVDPNLVAATAEVIRLYGLMKRARKARKVALKAWARSPHPEITHAYAALVPGESSLEKLRRIQTLAATNPTHPESHYAIAEAAVVARLWGIARDHLMVLAPSLTFRPLPEARLCRLMALVEREENTNLSVAQKWLEHAAEAPADKEWVCEECGTPTPAWAAVCAHCGGIATLGWQSRRTTLLPGRLASPGLLAPTMISGPAVAGPGVAGLLDQ